MPRRRTLALTATPLAAAGLTWEVVRRLDRRKIEADPLQQRLTARLHGRPQTVTSKDGTELHVEVFGPEDAPTIVLVHGWTCVWWFWTLQIQALHEQFRVVAYDLRGHGDSQKAEDYATERFGEDLAAVLEQAVPAGERPIVVGHSLGAMSLVAWAESVGPNAVHDRVRAAGLVSTGVQGLITEALVLKLPGSLLDRVQTRVGRIVLAARLPLPQTATPIGARVTRYVALSPAASPAAVAFCERVVLGVSPDVRGLVGEGLSRMDLTEGLNDLDVPVVVVTGLKDRLTPPVHAREMLEALPDARLVELPEAGHMTPVEDDAAITRVIRELADQTAGERSATPRPRPGAARAATAPR